MNKSNTEIARMLQRISFLLDMKEGKNNKVNFKNRAYIIAAERIEDLSTNIEDLYKSEGIKGLLSIPSIGKAIASKIEEFINTNEIQYYNQLKSGLSLDINEFLELKGIGPKTFEQCAGFIRIIPETSQKR